MRERNTCLARIVALAVATAFLVPIPARAQESSAGQKAPALEARLQALEQKVAEIEARLDDQTAKSADSTTPVPTGESPIALKLIDKQFQEADPLTGQGSDRLVLSLELKSELEQPLRAFTGTIVFRDIFGRDLLRTALTDEEGLNPGHTVTWRGWIPYQQYDENHRRLRSMDMKSLTFAFVLERVVYADGSTGVFAQRSSSEKAVQLNRLGPQAQAATGASGPPPAREPIPKSAPEIAPPAAEPPKQPVQPPDAAAAPAAPAAPVPQEATLPE